MIWNLRGTEPQNQLVRAALAACDFPFDELRPSLEREGKTAIDVEWTDLSRYTHGAEGHEHAEGAHTITRPIDGRMRVLGLFYLPPYTKVVLDTGLTSRPLLAQEVFLAEGAHAVDYHYALPYGLRPAIWNALHEAHEDVPEGFDMPESGDVDHGHSWFDGPGGYATWVGEAFMEAFTRAFAPSAPVTIQLAHPVSVEAAAQIRAALLDEAPVAEPVYQGSPRSKVFHDSHQRIEPTRWFDSPADAIDAGLRPCKVCKP